MQALAAQGVEITLVFPDAEPNAPFHPDGYTFRGHSICWRDARQQEAILKDLEEKVFDAVLVSSWNFRSYVKFARNAKRRRQRTATVMAFDNQWLETPRQWLGRLVAPQYVAKGFDAAFVPGDRQLAFAERMGFRGRPVLQGLYCADDHTFAVTARPAARREPAFLYVGRLVPHVKGIETLAIAYLSYRNRVAEPWPLRVSGHGPQDRQLAQIPGVEMVGFLQPAALADLMARSSCLVLPSAFEPWGVTVHEAALAGMPLVVSSSVGAASAFLREGRNGYCFHTGSADQLVERLIRIHHASPDALASMSAVSAQLGALWRTEDWAAKFRQDLEALRADLDRG